MASGDQRADVPDELDGSGLRIALVRSRWNATVVDRLVAGVDRGLLHLGIPAEDVVRETVPGAFEIPMACQAIAASGRVDAIVTVGAVIRGETTHYQLVSEGAAEGIRQVQLTTGVPIAMGLVTVEDEAQAMARSEGPGGHNVGEEAAQVAVEMARLVQRWKG